MVHVYTAGRGRVAQLARIQSALLMMFTASWLLLVMAIPNAMGARTVGASLRDGAG